MQFLKVWDSNFPGRPGKQVLLTDVCNLQYKIIQTFTKKTNICKWFQWSYSSLSQNLSQFQSYSDQLADSLFFSLSREHISFFTYSKSLIFNVYYRGEGWASSRVRKGKRGERDVSEGSGRECVQFLVKLS